MNDKEQPAIRTLKDVLGEARERFDKVEKHVVKLDELTIWGGFFDDEPGLFDKFLEMWRPCLQHFEWRIWEAVSRFDLVHSAGEALTPPAGEQLENIERLRVFGRGGDLFVRRDASRFYWRFIGDKTTADWPEPDSHFNPKDYAKDHPDQEFHKSEERYLLWNKTNKRGADGDKPEQRVSTFWRGSTLNNLPDTELYLTQWQYLDGGEVAFVRYVAITG